jgi:type IV fimbrial biogenesis protein FimT
MKKLPYVYGFTLVELLITLAIASILLAVATPSFTSLISSNAAGNAAARLQDSLAHARSEAVSRSTDVVVCSKSSGTNTCSTLNTWVDGWLIYIEGAGADSADAEVIGDDLILKVEGLNLNLNAVSGSSAAALTYNSLGEASAITISFIGGSDVAADGTDIAVSAQGLLSASHGATQSYTTSD